MAGAMPRRRLLCMRGAIEMKICNVIQTLCKNPMNCQYCFNGMFYTENIEGLSLTNSVLRRVMKEAYDEE
jgi:hypothetical protein